MDRVFQVLDLPADKPDRPDALSAPTVVQRLVFDHVHFAYENGRPVVVDFDVSVPGASVVALVAAAARARPA